MIRRKPRSSARAALALLLAAPVAGLAACSISKSSESLSTSISSPFKSSSDSSSGGGSEDAYLDEVRSYTSGFATSGGGDATAFRRGLGTKAEARGVHDWEDDDATCKAIGQGLKRAGVSREKARAFLGDVFAGRSERAKVALEGFED